MLHRKLYAVTVFAVLMISMPLALRSQTAKVESLSKDDAARVLQTYQTLQKATEAWNNLQTDIGMKYLTVPYDDPRKGYNSVPEPTGSIMGTISSGSIFCSSWDACGFASGSGGSSSQKKSKEETAKEEAEELARKKKLRWLRKDWDESTDFEFSKDFQYIVPKNQTKSDCRTGNTYITANGNCLTITPLGNGNVIY